MIRPDLVFVRSPARREAPWEVDDHQTCLFGRSDVAVELIADHEGARRCAGKPLHALVEAWMFGRLDDPVEMADQTCRLRGASDPLIRALGQDQD